MAGTEYYFPLQISRERYLAYYRGAVKNVLVTMQDGSTLQFPASALRPFVTNDGVNGQFILRVDENNKIIELIRG